MSTRSITLILDENKIEVLCLYRQSDGYPTGHGRELAEILKGHTECNGIGAKATETNAFNGANDLACYLVWKLKESQARNARKWSKIGHMSMSAIGQFYLQPSGTRDLDEEYTYTIQCHGEGTKPTITIRGEDTEKHGTAEMILTWIRKQLRNKRDRKARAKKGGA